MNPAAAVPLPLSLREENDKKPSKSFFHLHLKLTLFRAQTYKCSWRTRPRRTVVCLSPGSRRAVGASSAAAAGPERARNGLERRGVGSGPSGWAAGRGWAVRAAVRCVTEARSDRAPGPGGGRVTALEKSWRV